MTEKLVRDGLVAILYSPGFGAGWSTWGDHWLATDKRLVECFEAGGDVGLLANDIAEAEGLPEVYTGGVDDLRLTWLPEGTAYRIDEYDGSESVQTGASLWCVA